MIGMMAGAWRIPTGSAGEHFLSSTFQVTPPQDAARKRPWQGVLQLSRVKVPALAVP